jgi:hypothetical protein
LKIQSGLPSFWHLPPPWVLCRHSTHR